MIRRTSFFAIALGLVLGVALGLVYSWLIDPVRLYNTTPPLLRSDYRHEWIRLAALGYVADEDMERALIRLKGLRQEDIQDALAAMIEAYAAHGQPAPTMRKLSRLARQLDVNTPAMQIYLETPAPSAGNVLPTQMPTAGPATGLTPLPSPTPSPPSPTPLVFPSPISSPYRVIAQNLVCSGVPGQLRVWVQGPPPPTPTPLPRRPTPTPTGPQPLAGVALWLLWADGADRAVTGMRPWTSPGYADFVLQPGVSYALSVDEPNAPILSGLMLQPCPESDRMGSWEVIVEKTP